MESDGRFFGDFFKKKRMELNLTLRKFCVENGFDAGNVSKIERGLMAPSTDPDKLGAYAKALKIKEGSDEWQKFSDLAYASSGTIPSDIMSDEELVAKLPLVFRTIKGKKLDKEQLEKLAEEIKKV